MWKDPNFYTNILSSVLLISVFIVIFFFTYASRIEKNIVIKQTNQLANNLFNDIAFLKDKSFKKFIMNLNAGDLSKEDQKVKEQNKKLLYTASLYVGCASIIIILISGFMIWFYQLNWKLLFLLNIITLICVALTEFFFLTFIAQNYISFDPNYVKYIFLTKLQRFKQS